MASGNAGKLAEIRRLLWAGLGEAASALRLDGLAAVPGHLPPAEDGASYADNALKKARAACLPGAAVLAEDSGLEVDALGGAPGLRSARWASGPDGSALDGAGLNRALLARLGPSRARAAVMVAAVVVLLPDGTAFTGSGAVRGVLAEEPGGSGGFGYDAVFLLDDGRRLSLVPPEVKDEVSHRGQAVRAVLPQLRAWLERPA